MEYVALVKSKIAELGDAFKTASDLAAMLDNPIFAISKDGVDAREELFNTFCALLVRNGVEPPPLEEEFWRAKLRRKVAPKTRIERKRAFVALKRRLPAAAKRDKKIRAILELMNLFPDLYNSVSYESLRWSEIFAELQRALVDDLELNPVTPDYTKIKIPNPLVISPVRPITIVVIDDDTIELAKSGIVLAGIPNATLAFYHHNAGERTSGHSNVLFSVAKAVVALKPDIILMDEGLDDINGHDLVLAIRNEGCQALFVANTSGNADKLIDVGCYGNFSKGELIHGIIDAIQNV